MEFQILKIRRRRWIATFLIWLLLASSCLGSISLLTSERVQAAPHPFTGFDNGDGTEGNPFEISKPEQLHHVSVTEHVYNNKHFKLTANIDLSIYADQDGGQGWIPIGNFTNGLFRGSFDGGHYTITGLTINRPDEEHVGLFGFVQGTQITNVKLEGVSVIGKERVGGLVGLASELLSPAKIENSTVSGIVSGDSEIGGLVGITDRSQIINSSFAGEVKGMNGVGGLVGYSTSADIENSQASGTVQGNSYYAGGLVGHQIKGLVKNSTSTSSVDGINYVGGLAGLLEQGDIEDSSASGDVSGKSAVGGLVGGSRECIGADTCAPGKKIASTISSSAASGKVSVPFNSATRPEGKVGGLVGKALGRLIITESQATGDVIGAWDVGGLVGYAKGFYGEDLQINNSFATGSVKGYDPEYPKSVAKVGGLVGLSHYGRITDSYATGDVIGDHSVGGLVGEIYSGEIKGSYSTGHVQGDANVGGLVGRTLESHITNSYSTSLVTADTEGLNKNIQAVGGLVGLAGGDIISSYAEGDVVGKSDLGASLVGGLVGGGQSWIEDSYAKGNVTVETIEEDISQVGGLFGGDSGSIFDSYALGNVNVYSAEGDIYHIGGLAGNGLQNHYMNKIREIVNSFSKGDVVARSDLGDISNIGGLLGAGEGLIEESYATGNIEAQTTEGAILNLGGLLGGGSGSIIDSSTTGNVKGTSVKGWLFSIGGLVGGGFDSFSGDIESSHATGDVLGYSESHDVIGSTGIGGLVGSLEGNVHDSHATGKVNGDSMVGGLIGEHVEGEVKSSYAKGEVAGKMDVGGLIGFNGSLGEVQLSYAVGKVSSHGKIEGDPDSDSNVGGLVGQNFGKITRSYSTSPIVSAGQRAGGLVGYNVETGQIKNSYARGNVSGNKKVGGLIGVHLGEVENGYAANKVTTGANPERVGALIGSMIDEGFDAKHIYHTYWDTDLAEELEGIGLTSLNAQIEDVQGKATTEMKQRSSFPAWDFDEIWTMVENESYPCLQGLPCDEAGTPGNGGGTDPGDGGDPGNGDGTDPGDGGDPGNGSGTPPRSGGGGGGSGSVAYGPYTFTFGDKLTISVPAGATDRELSVTIREVTDLAKLIRNGEQLLSSVIEALPTPAQQLKKKAKLELTFDSKQLGENQKPSIFYYDDHKKEWIELGGTVENDKITVEIDRLGIFAVFAVDKGTKPELQQEEEKPLPVEEQQVNLGDIYGHWAETRIKEGVSKGIVSGYPDQTFRPDYTISRAEFTIMLIRALKLEGDTPLTAFTDQAKIGEWAQQAVRLAIQTGIISGYEDGSFRPNNPITRAEMAVMIVRTLTLPVTSTKITPFSDDAEIPFWAKEAIAQLAEQGIVSGRSGNRFAPQANASRAEAVVMLLRMLQHNHEK